MITGKEFFEKRRNRAIATILTFKDQYCDQYLPDNISSALREEILYQINQLSDIALDLLNEETYYNEIFFERFNKMYEMVSEMSEYDDD
jgi:hypothetical protein